MTTTGTATATLTMENTDDVKLIRKGVAFFRDNTPTADLNTAQRDTLTAIVNALDAVGGDS